MKPSLHVASSNTNDRILDGWNITMFRDDVSIQKVSTVRNSRISTQRSVVLYELQEGLQAYADECVEAEKAKLRKETWREVADWIESYQLTRSALNEPETLTKRIAESIRYQTEQGNDMSNNDKAQVTHFVATSDTSVDGYVSISSENNIVNVTAGDDQWQPEPEEFAEVQAYILSKDHPINNIVTAAMDLPRDTQGLSDLFDAIHATRKEMIEELRPSPVNHKYGDVLGQIKSFFDKMAPFPTAKNFRVQLGCDLEEDAERLDAINLVFANTNDIDPDFEELRRLTHLCATKLKTGQVEVQILDEVELLDANCDRIVTALGVSHMRGHNILGAAKEVANSNNSKFDENGQPIWDENGKMTKGLNFFRPSLAKFV